MSKRGRTIPITHMFVADFETCDAALVPEGEIADQRVWFAGIKNLATMKSTFFMNLDDFMTNILSRQDNQHREYAFHNLKFDGSYIIPWLLSNDYQVSLTKPHPGEFSVLVDERNAWYSITIQVTTRLKIYLWDSLKLFPSQLEYLPDIYHTPTRKVQEDQAFYERVRLPGYEPTEEEYGYLENDLGVLAETLNVHIGFYGIRFKKTQASQSFENFKDSFKAWKLRFPALSDEEDALIRPAYWGGISYVPPAKQGIDFWGVGVYDINSSYPHKIAERRLPYGECLSTKENTPPDMSKFWVAEVILSFSLKPDCLPCIPSKSITENRPITIDKWLHNSEGLVRMRLCSVDYYTIHESYDVNVVKWCWVKHWAQKRQLEMAQFVYRNNDLKVEHRKAAKLETDPHKRVEHLTIANRAKTDNNAFYGKFGEDIVKKGKTPYADDVEGVRWVMDRVDIQPERSRKYLPVAIAITAYGRQQLVEFANLMGPDFLYCDTDSIHYILQGGQEKIEAALKIGMIRTDDTKLGNWSLEGYMARGRYLRAKCYMEQDAMGVDLSTVAGLPADPHTGQGSKIRSCLNWDNFHIGHIIPADRSHKLCTIRTRTGDKLIPTDFTIQEKETIFS